MKPMDEKISDNIENMIALYGFYCHKTENNCDEANKKILQHIEKLEWRLEEMKKDTIKAINREGGVNAEF